MRFAWIVIAAAAGTPLMAASTTARADDEARPSNPVVSAPSNAPEGLSYAEREALAPELEEFAGGSSLGLAVLLAIVIVAAVVIIVWLIIPWK